MTVEPLSRKFLIVIVNKYIGVSSGYLGDFSYSTHRDFYPDYCDLDIDPMQFEGTTRERFIAILSDQEPVIQAKILRGVLLRFPLGDPHSPESRSLELHNAISEEICRLEQASPVESLISSYTSEVVNRAIRDTEALIKSNGATSAVDRVHTALHGFLRQICEGASLRLPVDPSLPAVFKALRDQHPHFQPVGPRSQDITQILRASGSILDAMNPLRNQASMAHPNDALLPSEEAMLVINVARSILQYLDAKLALNP